MKQSFGFVDIAFPHINVNWSSLPIKTSTYSRLSYTATNKDFSVGQK
jgi:hypothetical protein